ncbi:histidine triad (HIT) protein [Segniliparus rotundus DSM 44985]|uniref:Histidine triad (HIT) protein n=1 Tax=Segniliparus rotundus (strain ATCC BAA-972 / CDC 1076 / CIP 108378 / DSM 44985 / JCM 13578) TaxID=640132 RepID=D6ZBW0_SEGRD|nr:HIT family protein [Segniliparus rotundus]ADG96937.1 histidine triad (HIT) protein [Segniliparus rotundus DSM 44985]
MPSVFSAVIAGDLPGYFVWQDEDVVAFLSNAPISTGHTLVVPRQEVDNWQSVDPELFGKVMRVAQIIGQAVTTAFGAPRAGQLIAGFEVPHLHVHVFPAWGLGDFSFANADHAATAEQFEAAAQKIRAALAGESNSG